MVRRSSDAPRTLPSSVDAALARSDELARAQGRGSTALRDSSGNVLLMNAESPYPLLRPLGVDGSMAFAPDGTVKIISPDTLEDRNLTARDVTSSGQVNAGFVGATNMGAGEIGAGRGIFGNVQINGAGDFGGITGDHAGFNLIGVGTVNAGVVNAGELGGQVRDFQGDWAVAVLFADMAKIGVAENPIAGRYTGREMTLEGNCLVKGSVFTNGNFVDNTPSERRLKDHVEDLGDSLGEVIPHLRPSRWTWQDRDARDARVHVGIYVDEFADVEPDCVIPPVDPADVPTSEEGFFTDQARNYEDRALMAHLVRAVQQLSEQVDALTARLDAAT